MINVFQASNRGMSGAFNVKTIGIYLFKVKNGNTRKRVKSVQN